MVTADGSDVECFCVGLTFMILKSTLVGVIQFLFKFMRDFGLCLFSICAAEAASTWSVPWPNVGSKPNASVFVWGPLNPSSRNLIFTRFGTFLYTRGGQTCSVKAQVVNILHFTGPYDLFDNYSSLSLSEKAAR